MYTNIWSQRQVQRIEAPSEAENSREWQAMFSSPAKREARGGGPETTMVQAKRVPGMKAAVEGGSEGMYRRK